MNNTFISKDSIDPFSLNTFLRQFMDVSGSTSAYNSSGPKPPKKAKSSCNPLFINRGVLDFVYDKYLNGYAVEDIAAAMMHDERFCEGGQWESDFFSEDEINEIIDFMNMMKGI